ncbi:TPA: hypothetical protein VGS95_004506 [Vibrio parahaemolyticus]|nr:hypothetical protein [Vibrio parahaemolyticus]
MKKVLSVVVGICLLGTLYSLTQDGLSNREVTLFSSALAVLSMAISWLITDIYSESSKQSALEDAKNFHNENIKTYVVNASEKVNNISNELDRLSTWLKQINQDYADNEQHEVIVIRERVASATHLIETLKSVNDTTVNDWRGVIGEEIKTYREKEELEKQKQIDGLLLRIKNLEALDEQGEESSESMINARKDLDELLSDQGIVVNQQKKIQHVTRKCPNCSTTVGYDQHTRNDNIRQIRCSKISCNSVLISKYSERDKYFDLFAPEIEEQKAACLVCNTEHSLELPIYEGSMVKEKCNCFNVITMRYRNGSVRTSQSKTPAIASREITEEFLQQVLVLLPPQPWEKDVHKIVAKELNESNKVVQKAIKQLIRRGDLYDQVDGRLFEYKEVNIA